ncbi:MAG: TetR/AcrR family transcriptional regulator [Shimia sp.]
MGRAAGEKADGRGRDPKAVYVEEAYRIIAEEGLEALSIRGVARGLGVSHQAPYKHFASRDHILAAVVARTFAEFAAALEARPRDADPARDLHAMGLAYLRYAREHPLKYRLMFGTPLPKSEAHAAMMTEATRAFDLLRDRLATMDRADGTPGPDADAMFVWSVLHGFASISASDAASKFGMDEAARAALPEHVLARIGGGILPR